MFETPEFRERLVKVIEETASGQGLKINELRVANFLQEIAVRYEPDLLREERRKERWRQRGVPEALDGAGMVVREAARRTLSRGGDFILMSEIEEAHKAKFCSIWPFCR